MVKKSKFQIHFLHKNTCFWCRVSARSFCKTSAVGSFYCYLGNQLDVHAAREYQCAISFFVRLLGFLNVAFHEMASSGLVILCTF